MGRQAEIRLGLLERGQKPKRFRGAARQTGESISFVEPSAHLEIDPPSAGGANRGRGGGFGVG
jgi:hypothetical protein